MKLPPKYKISVLESMIEHYTKNIIMFQEMNTGPEYIENEIANMVANRRLIASFIEYGGVSTVPADFRNGDVFFDGMVNAACSGVEIF